MRRLARLLLAAAVLAAAAGGGLMIWAKTQPKPGLIPEDTHWSQAVTDRDGRLLHLTLSEDGAYRLPVLQGAVSREALDAAVRYEDRFFYSHPGVNPFSIVRAAWSTLTGPRRIGGSTITMQLARKLQNLDTRHWRGKVEQMLWALRYDMHYTKDEILTAYLSVTPYGGNVEGIEAASLVYFGKHASQLTAAESIALSVVPQNPVKRHPVTGADFDRARLAAGRKAIEEGFVSPRLRPAVEGPLKARSARELPFEAPHFTRLVEGVRPAPVLKTTLSLSIQNAMEKILSESVARLRPYGVENGAMLVVDSRDMSVLAQVGSVDFFASDIAGEVDGTRAPRSPGSTLKPFIYGLALDQGLIHSRSILLDARKSFRGYEPGNADKKFRGPLPAVEALNDSRNVPAVTLAGALRPDLYDFLREAGVPLKHPREHYGLSIVLGGAEASAEDLARLYGTLGNGGLLRPLVRLQDEEPAAARPMLSPEATWIVRRMLADGGETLKVEGVPVPLLWKTGTSNGFRDAWTAGYAGRWIIVVWLGNFNGRPDPWLQGALVAQPVFRSAAVRLLTDRAFAMSGEELKRFEAQPRNVVSEPVCRSTGDLALDAQGRVRCTDTVNAWFIPGVSPIRDTGFLKEILIDEATGLRACKEGEGTKRIFVESWPSEYQERFLEAGVIKAPLPDWKPECRPEGAVSGTPPDILSPRAGTRYYTGTAGLKQAGIVLKASLAPDARLVYWFAGDRFIGAAKAGGTVVWQADPGTHRVSAVDDLGRRSQRTVTVRQP